MKNDEGQECKRARGADKYERKDQRLDAVQMEIAKPQWAGKE